MAPTIEKISAVTFRVVNIGGSSWGNWETKQSILADMKDNKNNKTNSEVISDLNVRIYGDTAIATYKSI